MAVLAVVPTPTNSQVTRQAKDVLRLEQEREKTSSELSESQNMYMQSLEDIKVGRSVRPLQDASPLPQMGAMAPETHRAGPV